MEEGVRRGERRCQERSSERPLFKDSACKGRESLNNPGHKPWRGPAFPLAKRTP